ncbi:hypothetical protein EJ110_NYTH50717 [Nymphaea thermarum]|nr:hypothetical protein EJ110_NYTH50717 [Nymphaea thermarum]
MLRSLNQKAVYKMNFSSRNLPSSSQKFTAIKAGPRLCLGKELAYRQMMIFAVFFCIFFIFKLADASRKPKFSPMRTLQMENGPHLKASTRNTSKEPHQLYASPCHYVILDAHAIFRARWSDTSGRPKLFLLIPRV